MSNKLTVTADGSLTLYHPEIGEHYHSMHGAVQESRHVFLNAGLLHFLERAVSAYRVTVLEVGFGTGLNFLLSAGHCLEQHIHIDYCGIEAYPLAPGLLAATQYDKYVPYGLWQAFLNSYEAALKAPAPLSPFISLEICPVKALEFKGQLNADIVYFDAFGAAHQPGMWTDETLTHVCHFLKPGGIFVTYAITGNLKRSLRALGFTIEKLPGAPGKREMLRATKNPVARI